MPLGILRGGHPRVVRGQAGPWRAFRPPYLLLMTEPPDDNLDHYALGFYAPGKGLRREDCPYAEGTEAHSRWTAGYDAALKEDGRA
jgi:ribosome modulation factor